MKIAIKSVNSYVNLKKVIACCDILYLGNETCPHKLEEPDELKRMAAAINEKQKDVYYGIPIVQERNLEKVTNQIKLVLDLKEDCIFIINDFGIIYYLGEYPDNRNFKVFLGRLLNKTIESCPWHKHIIRNESEYIRGAMFTNSAHSRILIEYLKQFNVCGIEGNIVPNQVNSLQELKSKGYQLAMNYDYIYVTSGRFCPTAYFYKREIPTCTELCNTPIGIELSRIKDVFDLKDSYFHNPETKTLYGDMLVYGNLVIKKNEVNNNDIVPELYDSIIFDFREYQDNLDRLYKIIEEIRSVTIEVKK